MANYDNKLVVSERTHNVLTSPSSSDNIGISSLTIFNRIHITNGVRPSTATNGIRIYSDAQGSYINLTDGTNYGDVQVSNGTLYINTGSGTSPASSGIAVFSGSLHVKNDVLVNGSMKVVGPLYAADQFKTQIQDPFVDLNAGYSATSTKSSGVTFVNRTVNTSNTVAVFNTTSSLTTTTSMAGFLSAGDFIQIAGAAGTATDSVLLQDNNGIYQVSSITTTSITIVTNGTGHPAVANSFVAGTPSNPASVIISKVYLSSLAISDGSTNFNSKANENLVFGAGDSSSTLGSSYKFVMLEDTPPCLIEPVRSATTISIGDVVYKDSTGWGRTNATTTTSGNTQGFTIGVSGTAVAAGTPANARIFTGKGIKIALNFDVNPTTVGQPIYLTSTFKGTPTLPTTGRIIRLGFCLTTTNTGTVGQYNVELDISHIIDF